MSRPDAPVNVASSSSNNNIIDGNKQSENDESTTVRLFPNNGVKSLFDTDDDDDDDEFIIVSSTRQQWEKFHGIKSQHYYDDDHKNRQQRLGKDDNIVKCNNDLVGDEEEEEEDMLILVTTKPIRPLSTRRRYDNKTSSFIAMMRMPIRQFGQCLGIWTSLAEHEKMYSCWSICVGMILILFVTGIMFCIFMKRTRQKYEAKGAKRKNENTTSKSASRSTENQNTKSSMSCNITNKIAMTIDQEEEVAITALLAMRGNDESLETTTVTSTTIATATKSTTSFKSDVDVPLPEPCASSFEFDEPPPLLEASIEDDHSRISNVNTPQSIPTPDMVTSTSNNNTEYTIEMTKQFVKDIQLIEKVLKEMSIDPTLAKDYAIMLHSKNHIIESQKQLQYQQAILHMHHHELNRQLSSQQHEENIQAVKYDPNWKEKLSEQKTKCWNISSNVTRLWWEILLIQQLSKGIVPVIIQYYYQYQQQSDGMEFTISYDGNIFLKNLMYDMAWSLMREICDCHTSPSIGSTSAVSSSVASSSVKTTLSTTTILAAYLMNLLRQSISLEWCACYGYCLMRVSLLVPSTMFFHQCFRVFTLPSICHHLVNAIALTIFYGPQRILSLVWNIFTNLTILSSSSLGNLDEFQSTLETCLLITILFLMPIGNWYKTRNLFQQVEEKLTKASAVHFQEHYHRGQKRLEQWYWEQLIYRYTLLSLYFAMIVWDKMMGQI